MKILSSHFAAICDKYDSPAPNGSFARRCEAARSSEKNSLTAKIFKYALTAALFLLATAFLIGAAAGYWIIVSRSDVPTSGICSYDSTNLLRYYLADESSDQFGKALDGDLGSASATYDGEFHFPIVSKTPIKKFDGYDKALLPLQFDDFNYGGDLTQTYFNDFGYEYVLLTGFSAGAKISPENIKTSAEILKNQSNYTWIAGVPSDAGVYAVRITSLEEVTVVGSSATRSKYGSYIVIYTIAPATATITEAAPLSGSFIVENASSAQSAATMADNSIEGGDGTFIYGVDESGKPLNQGVKVTSLTLGGSSHSVSGYSDISVGSVKNGLNIVLSDNVKSAANHSEADNENFWYTVTASLSGAEAGNYALSNATSLRFRIAPVELNADDIKWYYAGKATNGKPVVYDGSEHGLTASIDETTVSNRYYAKYGNDESVKSAVKSLIDAINGGSAPLTLGVYARSNDNYTAPIPSTAKVAKNAGIYLFSADVYLGGKRSTDVYLATEATNTLTINAAQLMVNYGSDPVYNGKAQQPTFTLAGLIGNDGMGVNAKVTQDAAVVEPINVGSYTLTLSVSGETYLNYVFGEPTLTAETSTSHDYQIIPQPVSLTTSNVSDITYDGEVHAPTATYIDVSGATVNAAAITKDGTVINANEVKNAGEYTLTASLKDKKNYVWDDNNTTADKTYKWTISELKITVKVTNANQSATYNGAEPTINTETTVTLTGSVASAPSFVSNELSFSVTKETGVNTGTYTLTPSAEPKSGYSVDNYDITPTLGTFKIDKLYLKFSGIIEIDYGGSTTLSQDLLRRKLTPTNGTIPTGNAAPSFLSAVARTYDSSNDDNKAYTETKDAQGNITSISGEHGYYKVTLNSAFTVGSTYKVTAKLNSDNYAFAVGGNTIIVKYKTAKIGNAYYTIEDALSESASGNITLAGNSSGSASYIITSFTKLTYGELTAGYTQEDINNYFKNYKDCSSTNESINHYTLSGKTLIVPYADGVTASSTESTSAGTDKVYSALIIPNDITLNISSTMNITAEVGHIGTSNVCQVSAQGVVMNNGTINVKNGANILAYGYLKGSGTVNLESGATATDLFRIFDFKGGKASYATYEKYFPINSYSLHNISCKTIVNSGSTYKAFYSITAANKWFNGTVNIIAPTSESNTLFKLSSGYIKKSAKPASSWTSSDEEYTALDTIVGSNQICGQIDVIDIHGVAVDGEVKISIKVNLGFISQSVDMKTSKAVPLPIAYMDITICKDAKMTLSNCSYKFMPGAKLTVEEGATLETASGVQLVMYSTIQCNSAENFEGNPEPFYPGLCVDQTDALLIVNGTATIYGRVSGKILSKSKDAVLTITTNNTEITVLKSYSDSLLGSIETETTTAKAIGNTVDGENQNLENTTYKSQEVGSNIVWVKANNIKTITFNSCGGTLISPKTIILTNGEFTIPATNEDGSAYLETPSLDYYTFVGWFTAKDGGKQISVGSIVSAADAVNNEIKLYAHWTPNTYQIVYEMKGDVPTEFTNPLPTSYTTGDEAITLQRLDSVTVGESTYTFVGWHYDSNCTQKADKIDTSVLGSFVRNESVTPMTLTVYGNWTIAATYNVTIKYVVRLDENEATVNDANNNPISIDNSQQQFVDGIDNNYTVEVTVNGNNLGTSYEIENYDYKYYFAGYSAGSGTNGCTVTQGEEAGKFIIRASNAGEVTIYVEFKTKVTAVVQFLDEGNSNNGIRSTQKYFMPGSKYSDMHVAVGTISEGYDTIEKSDSSNGYKYIEKYAIGVTTNGSTIDISNDHNNETLLQSGDTITVTLYYRKIITVTLTMSATAEKCSKLPHSIDSKFNITSVELDTMLWFSNNTGTPWYESGSPEYSANGESIFYVLQGSIIKVQTDQKNCKKLIGGDCGKKATLTKNQVTCSGCSVTDAGNGTFTITPNGNGAVNVTWSGSVKAS